jgi:hypothetical protein
VIYGAEKGLLQNRFGSDVKQSWTLYKGNNVRLHTILIFPPKPPLLPALELTQLSLGAGSCLYIVLTARSSCAAGTRVE